MREPISAQKFHVFFDESGKRKDSPNLMGALSFPTPLYQTPAFAAFTQELRTGAIKLHWKEYAGHSPTRNAIIEAFRLLANHHLLLKCNVIHYDYSLISRNDQNGNLAEQMIYTKFPERIIYGLLRGYGKKTNLECNIQIEHSSEYESFRLHETIKKQLNIQALYRGEKFFVTESSLIPKGQEIGLELVDLILGVMRTIISNKPNLNSNNVRYKNELVVDLLKDLQCYAFIQQIRYFEWDSSRELKEIHFKDYVQCFLAEHLSRFFEQR